MPGFQRSQPQKFVAKGMSLSHAHDVLPPGKFPLLRNVRSYIGGVVEPRPGMNAVSLDTLAELNVHSIKRLVSDIPSASPAFTRVVGSGTKLYTIDGGVSTERDSGYSGDPLSMIRHRPPRSPEAYLYIADANKMRKIRADGTDFQMGIAPPNVAPTVAIGAPSYNSIEEFEAVGSWANGGTAGAISTPDRFNTTVSRILFDIGTTGWASVQPAAFASFQVGARVIISGAVETVTVERIFKAITTTTIGSIIYDSGSAGLCTIQPTTPTEGLRADAALVLDLGGGAEEMVRVLSVTVGPDGISSFRCSTVNTQIATNGIDGISTFRAFFASTHAAADTLTGKHFRSTITTGDGLLSLAVALNLAKIATRPTQEDDEIHVSIRIDDLSKVVEGRIFLDVDSTLNDFTQNYFFSAFRPNDLVAAVDGTLTVLTARQRQIQRDLIDSAFADVVGGQTRLDFLRSERFRDRFDIDEVIERLFSPLASPSGATSGQTPTGDSQWFELRIKVKDLERVGSDASRGLKDVAAIRISLQVTGTVVLDVDSWWLGGSFGPDAGDIGLPFLYRYRGRSSVTGAKSNPSPPTRSGILPRRQNVVISMTQHPDAQVDLLDVYRFGGALAGWTYVGTAANGASPQHTDVFSDSAIVGGDRLEFDNFQPFPTIDVPRSGTCNVAGTTVSWVSGDTFDVNWAPGSVINIDGINHILYRQPTSTTRLETVENVGTKSAVAFRLEQPTLLGQPMPVMWGPLAGETAVFLFACGDPFQPGVVFITKGNDPDSAPEQFHIEVTSPSEPMMNGVVYDGRVYAWSSERRFALYPSFGSFGGNVFTPLEVPGGKGLFSRWMLAVGPKIWFGSKDGIYETLGSGQNSITDEDLHEFFPGEGRAPRSVTIAGVTIDPPDFSKVADLRLHYYERILYFDFVDTSNNRRTLLYDTRTEGWFLDQYTPEVIVHAGEEGRGLNSLLLGGVDGKVYQASGSADDAGTAIACLVLTPSLDLADARAKKLIGDIAVEADTKGIAVTVTPWIDDYETALAAKVITTSALIQTIIDIRDGKGELAEEIALALLWSATAVGRPELHEWDPAFVPKPEDTFLRGTDFDNAGYQGAKFVQGVIIEADTGGAARTVQVQSDGGAVQATLTVNHSGQIEAPFSFTPFVAHTLRLVPTDANSWRLFNVRWVWEPMPELATVWETQGTTHDIPGFQHLRDGYISLISSGIVTLTVTLDGVPFVVTIPSTAGVHSKPYVVFPARKGKQYVYKLTAAAGFRLFQRDCEVRVKGWGQNGPYTIVNPFGDVHREQGARI